ncbi:AgmX/PglI C-terminal domain-containing protein [bacterium]|nr:AgmX/PglI C-terminal domain-containing protein [bacterium]
MKKKRILMITIIFCLLVPPTIFADVEVNDDKTLSPYFLVKSDDPALDQLPLLETSAAVDIAGVIADVKVKQVYKNDGDRVIEAIYVFPASTRAAVYGMKMTIGERTIIAKIEEKEEARQQYEQAKEEGKTASLLEQQRPNVFQMNVANILPGDTIIVELNYTELLVPEDGVYSFIYPTVVGPRYSNLPESEAPPGEEWIENPYLHEGEAPPYTFDIGVNVSAGLPIQEMVCTSHEVDIDYEGKSYGVVKLAKSEKHGGNRDFILNYRLAGGQIESGLLLFEGEEENFFLLMLQPPERVTSEDIPPREYIFIMDVSGSMHGFPINISKAVLRDLIGNLRPSDKFNLMLFAGASEVMAQNSVPATEENVKRAIDIIDNQRGGGGTEILPALQKALNLSRSPGSSRSVVIVTDGYVRVEKEAFDLIRENLGDANMFAFGIGSSVNRFLIEGIAHVGMGEPFIITDENKAPAQADKFRKYIQSPVLTQIKADFEGFDTYDVEPISIPDVLAERPIIIFGKYNGEPKGEIKVTGYHGDDEYSEVVKVADSKPMDNNSALKYLWARHKITLLSDYNSISSTDELKEEITDLGLQYNLLTQYTSFVAIDSEVRTDGQATTVKQPLPLPQGVSDYAVGGKMAMQRTMAAPISPDMAFAEVEKPATEPHVLQPRFKVTIDKLKTKDGLSEDDVRSFLESRLGVIQRCYYKALSTDASLEGKLELEFKIDSTGVITDLKILSNKLNKQLADCVLDEFKKMSYPPDSAIETMVTVTFKFEK